MENESIEQFLHWLAKEGIKSPALEGCGEEAMAWYAIGYQDALRNIQAMYSLAFKDEL